VGSVLARAKRGNAIRNTARAAAINRCIHVLRKTPVIVSRAPLE
jgi:hypothetical protein